MKPKDVVGDAFDAHEVRWIAITGYRKNSGPATIPCPVGKLHMRYFSLNTELKHGC